MKLIKLNNEYHLFVDIRITVEGVFPYVTKWENGKYELRNTNNRIATSLMHRSRKIVASTQKEVGFISSDVIWIDRKQIECLLGVTDKAKDYTEKEYCMIGDVDELNGEPFAVYEAYKQALKDNSDKKFTLEEDISLEIGKLAIEMGNLRKEDLLKDAKESKTVRAWNWLNKQMENLNKMVFPFLEINSEKGTQMALKDIVGLFAYIFKNYEIILSRADPLAKQFESIIVFGSLDSLIKDSQEENGMNSVATNSPMKVMNEVPTKVKKKSKKCNIF